MSSWRPGIVGCPRLKRGQRLTLFGPPEIGLSLHALVIVRNSIPRGGGEGPGDHQGLFGQKTGVAGVLLAACHGARRGQGGTLCGSRFRVLYGNARGDEATLLGVYVRGADKSTSHGLGLGGHCIRPSVQVTSISRAPPMFSNRTRGILKGEKSECV